jgi:signal peptidase I
MKWKASWSIWLVGSIALWLLSACAQEKVFTQPNSAMEPTVFAGEKFAVDMNTYRNATPGRGDVVVVRHDDALLLKRVIAVAGDTVEGADFQVFLNGVALHEEFIQHTGKDSVLRSPSSSFLKTFKPAKVSANQLFVMGDNRDFSDDSRDSRFGTVPVTDVMGKAVRIVKSSDPRRAGLTIH